MQLTTYFNEQTLTLSTPYALGDIIQYYDGPAKNNDGEILYGTAKNCPFCAGTTKIQTFNGEVNCPYCKAQGTIKPTKLQAIKYGKIIGINTSYNSRLKLSNRPCVQYYIQPQILENGEYIDDTNQNARWILLHQFTARDSVVNINGNTVIDTSNATPNGSQWSIQPVGAEYKNRVN